jgi:hypothetical protein
MRQAMISVLIQTHNDEEALARTLASLVGGSIEGVVREVIVCDRGSIDQTRLVAEHAGCDACGRGRPWRRRSRARAATGCCCWSPARGWTEGWPEQALLHMGSRGRAGALTRSRIGQPGFFVAAV